MKIKLSLNLFKIRYVKHPDGENVTKEFLESGNYEIEVMGKRYLLDLYLRSPFDPQNQRLLGIYENKFDSKS